MSFTHLSSLSFEAILVFALLGLIVGSFVNVLIHRLPVMILASEDNPASDFNLMTPRSHCPHCHHSLQWFELIPLFSYVFLKGRCGHCAQSISILSEIFSGRSTTVAGKSLVFLGCRIATEPMPTAENASPLFHLYSANCMKI